MAKEQQENLSLPETGFVRLPTVLHHFPISASGWRNGIRDGRFPKPVKLGPRTAAWRAEDIRKLLADTAQAA